MLKWRVWAIAVGVVLLAATVAGLLPAPKPGKTMDRVADWMGYWSAARLALTGGDPYAENELSELQRLNGRLTDDAFRIYVPPHTFIPLMPFAALPLVYSSDLWMLLGVASTIACGWVWSRRLESKIGSGTIEESRGQTANANSPSFPIVFAASLVFAPTLFCIEYRQMGFLLLIGCVGLAVSARDRSDVLCGLFLAILTIKPHIVYLLGIVAIYWIVSERRWKAALTAGVTIAACYGILFIWNRQAIVGFQRVLSEPPIAFRTATFGSMLRLWINPDSAYLQFAPTLLTAVATGFWLMWRRPSVDWNTWLAPVLLLSTMTASYGWCFDQIVLAPVQVEIAMKAMATRNGLRPRSMVLACAALGATCLAIVQSNTAYSEHLYFFWFPWVLAAIYLLAPGHFWSTGEFGPG